MVERANGQSDVERAHLVPVEGVEPTAVHRAQGWIDRYGGISATTTTTANTTITSSAALSRVGVIVCQGIVLHGDNLRFSKL